MDALLTFRQKMEPKMLEKIQAELTMLKAHHEAMSDKIRNIEGLLNANQTNATNANIAGIAAEVIAKRRAWREKKRGR